jgi:AcrR family transcriptional regulator
MSAASRTELRRDRLIDAAQAVFARDGLRGASMERIAAEAGVARATVYAYFADKEDAFRAVCQRLADGLVASAHAALAAPGPPAARVREALLAKHVFAFSAAHASPHVADLLAAKDRLAAPIFAAADTAIEEAVATVLAEQGLEAEVAALLMAACGGIFDSAPDATTLQRRITLLVDAVLRGVG